MQPYAATVGRAVIGLAVVFVGRRAPASAASGFAIHSDNRFVTLLRRPRHRAGGGASIRTIGLEREDMP